MLFPSFIVLFVTFFFLFVFITTFFHKILSLLNFLVFGPRVFYPLVLSVFFVQVSYNPARGYFGPAQKGHFNIWCT